MGMFIIYGEICQSGLSSWPNGMVGMRRMGDEAEYIPSMRMYHPYIHHCCTCHSLCLLAERGEDIDRQAPSGIGYLRGCRKGGGRGGGRRARNDCGGEKRSAVMDDFACNSPNFCRIEFGTAHSKMMCRSRIILFLISLCVSTIVCTSPMQSRAK